MRSLYSFLFLFACYCTSYAQSIVWQDTSSNAQVYLHIDESDYKDHKHRKSGKYDVKELDPKYHKEVLGIVNTALRKYPPSVLNEHIDKLYVYDEFDEGNLDGIYLGRHGFFFAVPFNEDGTIDALRLESLIHHEFSHRFQMFDTKSFDLQEWKEINELNYGEIKSYDRTFDPSLYDKGFINKYAVLNKFEDIASFGENIFIYQEQFWKAIDEHPVLRRKFELIAGYYESMDPMFSVEYFEGFRRD